MAKSYFWIKVSKLLKNYIQTWMTNVILMKKEPFYGFWFKFVMKLLIENCQKMSNGCNFVRLNHLFDSFVILNFFFHFPFQTENSSTNLNIVCKNHDDWNGNIRKKCPQLVQYHFYRWLILSLLTVHANLYKCNE